MIVQARQAKKMKETKTEKEGEEAKEVYTLTRNTPTKIMGEWPPFIQLQLPIERKVVRQRRR